MKQALKNHPARLDSPGILPNSVWFHLVILSVSIHRCPPRIPPTGPWAILLCPAAKWRGGSRSSPSGGFLLPSSIDEKGPQTKDANTEASPLQGRSGDMLSPRDPVASQSHPHLGQFVRGRGSQAGISISKARAL